MSKLTLQQTRFQTSDGVRLRGTLFVPPAPDVAVVISGAVGVPEQFYRHFAAWLAEAHNMVVLTYTYRDMHDTSPRAMRASAAKLEDWAITDAQAARDAIRAGNPDLPVWLIGHSLGGMMVSKQPRLDGVSRLITIASGVVDHKAHPMPYRLLVWFFWFLAGPICTRLLGYLPGKSIGLGATLPARVFWQWRKWCTAGPEGFLSDASLPPSNWYRSGAPVRIIGISDDAICPPQCAFNLARAYEGADVEMVELSPQDHGQASLGHFRIFTKAGKDWWPQIIARPTPSLADSLNRKTG